MFLNQEEKELFWKKQTSGEENLPGPKDIPEIVGRHLVVVLKQDPDWVWKLKGVVRPHPENKHLFDIRIFDCAQTDGFQVKIQNYNSFNSHPELVLFEGSFNKQSMQVQLKKSAQ